ncbi:PREDICTED: stAR-related lipid transfer protein 9 [Chrysochloris asiatica]|uniref:StAR-related lipid transfer protein 9 n=1 Tax=Chrysochloris asiatica TaxID=185453 RepID=A0A9B0WF72_CHRAS|nr:PREDICTED: stAR-related lipid transfer protein 9 [Chrysochloris asiatica]
MGGAVRRGEWGGRARDWGCGSGTGQGCCRWTGLLGVGCGEGMANVRVALRVRPLSKRETKDGGRIIMEVDGKVAKIRNLKVDSRSDGFGDSREKVVTFGFDYCYWSVNPEDPQYASQDVVFQDLGTEVLSGAARGYNICLFAYGQTGSGKTYTMLGTPASVGLTPRICEGLFIKEEDCSSLPSSCKIKISFLEIYNERVRDLLKQSDQNKSNPLRVREHPEMGPYVQGLSQHVVTSYKQVIQLLEEGIANRITAATHVHEASSRSHAIFTIHYTQAILENNFPSEIASKINLVDLAGSERADPSYCKDRITEGANINKSLVTLGIVISTLAQNSQVFSSCQSLTSAASNGGDSEIPGSHSGTSSGGGPARRQSYIPYRDSVLTWLLKDSLGGNSKTIMVATVSPAHTSYSETMSTLRYASNAKNIINKPRVNEDANVKLIRELREEIQRLKAMLLSFELRNFTSLDDEKDDNLKELVLQNELKIDQLTEDWTQKWSDWKALMEHYSVDINRRRAGLVIDSSLPHLTALEEDVLSTGVVLYHLKEGTTKIGRIDSAQEQDIVLQGQWIERDHCTITSACGVVILRPTQGARCTVNGRQVTASCRLTQGAVITLGKAQKFRFNHPAEAAILRRRRQAGEAVGGSGSLEWLDLDGDITASRLGCCPLLWKERKVLGEPCEETHPQLRDGETSHRAQIHQQQCYVEGLRQQILAGQIQAEQELELDQARINQQIEDNQQWLLREETWLASLQQQQQKDCVKEKELEAPVVLNTWLQTDAEVQPSPLVRSQKRVVQLQLLRRHALRAAERNVRRKKATFQLERIIKKQRLLEAQKSLEQLKVLCWLQDDSSQEPADQVSSPDATVPGPRRRSKSTSCSSLSQYLPQPHSILLHWDPSITLPPMPCPTRQMSEQTSSEEHLLQAAAYPPWMRRVNKNDLCSSGQGQLCTARRDMAMKGASAPSTCLAMSPASASVQEMERVGKQPRRKVAQDSASLSQPANKLKPKEEAEVLTPTSRSRRAKGVKGSGYMRAGWRKEGNLSTHKVAREASCSSSHPREPKQTSGRGKAAKTFRADSKPAFPSRASNRQPRVLAVVRDTAQQSWHLPLGSPLKWQHGAGDPNTMAPLTDASPVVGHAGEKDGGFSDTHSDCSVDSLSCDYAKAPAMLLKPQESQGKKLGLPEPENSESDESQISEDSLTERGYQSQKDSTVGSYVTSDPGYHMDRLKASERDHTTHTDSGLLAHTHKSFSLDSLIDVEEELGEDQQEEPLLGSPDEMPTETFWHLQSSSVSGVDQEVTSNSFYLDHPPLQSHCNPAPEPAAEACCSKKACSPPGILPSRGSPLISMDSWFSCDSKINASNPPGTVGSLCLSPDVQECQPCGWERRTMEELKLSGAEVVLPYSFKRLKGSADLSCDVRDEYTTSASDMSKLSLWETHQLLQPEADGTSQGSCGPDIAERGTSEASNSSSVSNVLAASAASLTHLSSTCERNWSTLQQKYLLELSHPVLKAIGEPRPAFPCLEEDSGSLAQSSGTAGDTFLLVGPGLSSNLNVNQFSIHLAESRHLRAEKEDRLTDKSEGTSRFFRISEKEVSYNETSTADLESLVSGMTNTHVFAAEIPELMAEAHEIRQSHLEVCSQGGRTPAPMAPSDNYVSLETPCHGNGAMTIKDHHWSQGWAPLRKNIASQTGQPRYNSHHALLEEDADCQESSQDTQFSFAVPSESELYLPRAPWDPFPSSLQPPPLETFYVTKSRDALTETALEIPACRKMRVRSPPLREAWGISHDHQICHDASLKKKRPVLLQIQGSEMALSQQVTAQRPADLSTRDTVREVGKCPTSRRKESHNSISVAQNRHIFSSVGTRAYKLENQVRILNKKDQNQAFDMNRQFSSRARSDFVYKNINLGLEKNMLGETAISLKCRPVDHSANSQVIVSQDENPAHKWEGKIETGHLRKALHPKDSSDEFKLPGIYCTYERFQTVPSIPERNLNECKQPRKSQERTKEESSGKRQNKRVNNDDEMARLIRSIKQLEHSLLEIGSKQSKHLHASHIPGVSKERVFQDHEKADHILRPGSPRDHLSFKDQSPSPKEHVILRDSEAREMKELSSCLRKDPRVQSPFKTRECIEEIQLVREPTHSAALDSSAREAWDYLGTCTAHRDPTETSIHPRRRTALARTLPLQPWQEKASQNECQLFGASISPKGQPYDLTGLEELEIVGGFQENHVAEHTSSSEQEQLKVQGRIGEINMQMGGSLQGENKMGSSTQKLLSPSLLCMSRFFSQETVCPLLSQTDTSTAASYQDLMNTVPFNSPGLPQSYFYAPDTVGIFSVDYVLDPTVFKIHDSPLVPRVEHQDQSGDTRSYSPPGHVRGITSVSHTAWCGPTISMALGSLGQSSIPESISLEEEDRTLASTSPPDQGAGLRSTFMDVSIREGFDSAKEAAIQKERKSPLRWVSSQHENKVGGPFEEGDFQDRKTRQKAENDAENFSLTSDNISEPASLTKVSSPEPRVWEHSVHASLCLALLKEVRQAKAQGKQLNNFVARRTVFPYYETLLEPECSSRVPGMPQYKQMDQPEWTRARNEGEAQEFHVRALSPEPGHLLVDERKILQTTPLPVEDFQLLPSSETHEGTWLPSQAASPAAPALDNSHFTGELRHLLGGGKQFICNSSSSEIIEKKEATRKPFSPGPLDSEEGRRVEPQKVVPALSSQAPSYDPEIMPHAPSERAICDTADGAPPDCQERRPEQQELSTQEPPYGGGSGNFLVSKQEGKSTYFESQSVLSDQSSASVSGPKQDHVQCLDATGLEDVIGLEDGRASPKPGALKPGVVRRGELEEPSQQQCPNRNGSVGSGITETCRSGSRHPRLSSLPDPRASLEPGGVGDEAPFRCVGETFHCASSGSIDGSRALPSLQLSDAQPGAVHTCSPCAIPLLCHGSGDQERDTSHPPWIVPSRTYSGDKRRASHSREPDMLLAHGLKPTDMNLELEPADYSTLEASVTAAVSSPAQGCSSPLAADKRTGSLAHSTAEKSSRSAEGPERKSEKRASIESENVPPLGMCSEPLRKFQDSYSRDQNSVVSQTKPKPPTTNRGPTAQNFSERSVENELVAEPQCRGCLENTFRCFSERSQLSTESRDHSALDFQAKFVTSLKHVKNPRVDSPWEEEEQQRDPAQDSSCPPSDEDGLGGQLRDARTEEEVVPQLERLSSDFEDSAIVGLGQSRLGQPCSVREQWSSNHRGSVPVIAIACRPKCSFRAPPRPQFSVVSSSRSLQELNLSVEPPFPTDEDTQGTNRSWNPHPKDCSGEVTARAARKAGDCSQKGSSNSNTRTADHGPLKPVALLYPPSSAPSCMPTPSILTSWMPGTLKQAHKGRPEKPTGQSRPQCLPEADKRMLHVVSSDISPCVLPWCSDRPECMSWKQFVFGSAVDVSSSHTVQGLTSSNVAWSSSMDKGLENQNTPFHSHLSSCANAQNLSSTHSSTENAQASNEASNIWDRHTVTGPEGADQGSQFKGPPDEAGLESKPSLPGEHAAGPVDEMLLLYPSAADHIGGQARVGTLEQGTQTLGSRLHWSHTDATSAAPEASASLASPLASWTSMHNLSLHLSQLLHSTSELLGSLSQPSMARKEPNTKKSPGEAPQAHRMDGCTQTTADKGSQTDLPSLPLPLQPPETNPQKVSVILEVLGSDVSMAPEKRQAEETEWKVAGPSDLQKESIHCRPQQPLVTSSRLRFQKEPLEQKLSPLSLQDSPTVFLPLCSQPETSSCLVASSPSPSISRSSGLFPNTAEATGEPRLQKILGLPSALLVDRASSPILTLSANAQGSGFLPGSVTPSAPSAPPLTGHQKLVSSPDLPLDAPTPPMGHYPQPSDELSDSQRGEAVCGEGGSSLERRDRTAFLELHMLDSPQPCPERQAGILGQSPQQLEPGTTQAVPTWVQKLPLPLLRNRRWMLAKSDANEEVVSPECDPLSSRGPSRSLEVSSPQGDTKHLSPCPGSELTDITGLQDSTSGPARVCQPERLLSPDSQTCSAPVPSHHSLGDLPVHNKFSNWCGVCDDSPGGLNMTKELGTGCDISSEDQEERPPHTPEDQSQIPKWTQREQIPLQVGAPNFSVSTELTEAKLHHGFGEADALLQVLQSGTGEALAAHEPVHSGWEELYARQKKAIQTLWRERTDRLHNFRRTRSLSPQKQLSFLSNLDFPSRRREYLQQLRKEVVETTRSSEAAPRSAHLPSDIELMLRDYRQAREKAKVEIARARDRLREQTEQEKLRIRQQIVSRLLREEEKLHTLANSSPLCTSSSGSLSSGYNSNPTLCGQLPSPDSLGDTNLSDSRDIWIGDGRGHSAVRNNHLYVAGGSLGSCCCSPSSLSSSGTCFPSSYQDLAKHIVDTSMADVMAACSDNLHHLFMGQAAAGWSYQGEEQEIQLYYKVFSSTRHGFLGAGVVTQPLPQVWTAVSDPTLWPLYHKPIQTARLHQRVTNNISLVYLVCNTTLCAMKQPRDFCCVCVEAKEGQLSIMAAQSVYDTSMPRPSKEMVRGEILPSAWILQPLTMEGKEMTRVIYLTQVELGAPGFPPQLLNSFIKQQPLVIARLASFLAIKSQDWLWPWPALAYGVQNPAATGQDSQS